MFGFFLIAHMLGFFVVVKLMTFFEWLAINYIVVFI